MLVCLQSAEDTLKLLPCYCRRHSEATAPCLGPATPPFPSPTAAWDPLIQGTVLWNPEQGDQVQKNEGGDGSGGHGFYLRKLAGGYHSGSFHGLRAKLLNLYHPISPDSLKAWHHQGVKSQGEAALKD